MSTRIVFQSPQWVWVDVVNPTDSELKELAKKYHLHRASVEDCLDPIHFPKLEEFPAYRFILFRAADENAPQDGDTVRELTRKVALFFSSQFLISFHRQKQPYLEQLEKEWVSKLGTSEIEESLRSELICKSYCRKVIESYRKPLEDSTNALDLCEMGIFGASDVPPFDVRNGYIIKRKAFVYKRMLRETKDVLTKLYLHRDEEFQDAHEAVDSLYFQADDLSETMTSLLGLHLSLSAQRTNEVIRVLTILSMFILPLTVIAGIYGMNFQHMPELTWKWGYPFSLGLMVAVELLIFAWFRKKGWLK